MLAGRQGPARFTTGDIFGLFSKSISWHDIDLRDSYLEMPYADADIASADSHAPNL